MKSTNCLLLIIVLSVFSLGTVSAQSESGKDSTGLPGDNFSLQGALEMFQKASSPEEFEKLINTPDNHINNLDLNGDGKIDYVRVTDNGKDKAHVFVLQDAVSDRESQDIAVIELEKTGDSSAVLQIVGDEDIYGTQVIVEPNGDTGGNTFNDNGADDYAIHGPNAVNVDFAQGVVVNVWFWPCVRFVYFPNYVIWRSPWRWNYYPGWWKPWRPYGWYVWHPFHYGYERHFAIVTEHRVWAARRIYTPIRVASVSVRTRNQAVVNNYRVTRTRTTVTGTRGNSFQRTTTRTTREHHTRTREHTTRVRERGKVRRR